VDAGGCAVVFRAVGGRWRGGRFGRFVLKGVGVLQALQPPLRAAGTPVGTSEEDSPWKGEEVVYGCLGMGRVCLSAWCEEEVKQAYDFGCPLFAYREQHGLADAVRGR
jgi:hypothetical protein